MTLITSSYGNLDRFFKANYFPLLPGWQPQPTDKIAQETKFGFWLVFSSDFLSRFRSKDPPLKYNSLNSFTIFSLLNCSILPNDWQKQFPVKTEIGVNHNNMQQLHIYYAIPSWRYRSLKMGNTNTKPNMHINKCLSIPLLNLSQRKNYLSFKVMDYGCMMSRFQIIYCPNHHYVELK